MTLASATPGSQPYNITIAGAIGNGAGKGLDIQAGRALRFDLRGIATKGMNVTLGASPLVGADILLNSWGQERFYSYDIDPSAARSFATPGPVFDRDGSGIVLGGSSLAAPMVDRDCRVLDAAGTPIANVMGLGLSAGFVPHGTLGGEPSFRGQTNGIWLWQNGVGAMIVNALLMPASRRDARHVAA